MSNVHILLVGLVGVGLLGCGRIGSDDFDVGPSPDDAGSAARDATVVDDDAGGSGVDGGVDGGVVLDATVLADGGVSDGGPVIPPTEWPSASIWYDSATATTDVHARGLAFVGGWLWVIGDYRGSVGILPPSTTTRGFMGQLAPDMTSGAITLAFNWFNTADAMTKMGNGIASLPGGVVVAASITPTPDEGLRIHQFDVGFGGERAASAFDWVGVTDVAVAGDTSDFFVAATVDGSVGGVATTDALVITRGWLIGSTEVRLAPPFVLDEEWAFEGVSLAATGSDFAVVTRGTGTRTIRIGGVDVGAPAPGGDPLVILGESDGSSIAVRSATRIARAGIEGTLATTLSASGTARVLIESTTGTDLVDVDDTGEVGSLHMMDARMGPGGAALSLDSGVVLSASIGDHHQAQIAHATTRVTATSAFADATGYVDVGAMVSNGTFVWVAGSAVNPTGIGSSDHPKLFVSSFYAP